MRIFLLGYMGSGKTTTGKKLAEHLGYSYLDMDTEIEKEQGMTITQIFQTYGEDRFRSMERNMLLKLIELENVVISTGGGVPCFGNNMELINNSSISVYLKLTPEMLAGRLRFTGKSRPLLNDLSEDELLEFVYRQLQERETWYQKATLIYNAMDLNVNELAEQVSSLF